MGLEKIRDLEANPKFLALPFHEQQNIRAEFFTKNAADDAKFASLAPQERQAIFDDYVSSPPRFANPQTGQVVNFINAAAKKGDVRAKNFWMGVALDADLLGASLFLKLGMKLVKALGVDGSAFEKWGPNAKDLPWWQTALTNGVPDTSSVRASPEYDKLIEYARYMTSRDFRTQRQYQMFSTLQNVLAVGAESAALIVPTMGVGLSSAKGLGTLIAKSASKWEAAAIARAGAWQQLGVWGARAGGETLHGVGTGLIGMARGLALNALNKVQGDPTGAVRMRNAWDYFRDYFAFDILGNLAMGVAAPFLKVTGKAFVGGKTLRDVYKGLGQGDVELLIKQAVTGTGFDPLLFNRVPKEVQESLDLVKKKMVVFDSVPRMTEEQLFDLVALKSGYIVKQDNGLWHMLPVGDPSTPLASLKSYDAAKTWLTEELDKILLPMGTKDPRGAMGMVFTSRLNQIRSIVRGRVPNDAVNSPEVLANLFAPRAGKFTHDRLRNFTRGYLYAIGEDPKVIKTLKLQDFVDEGRDWIRVKVGGVEAGVFPAEVRYAGEEASLLREFMDNTKGLGTNVGRIQKVEEALLGSYDSAVNKQLIFTPEWAQYAIRKVYPGATVAREGKSWVVRADKTPQLWAEFNSLDELGDWVTKEVIDDKYLAAHLKQTFGMKLTKDAEGFKIFDKGKEIARGETPGDLLSARPDLAPKINSLLGPEFVVSPNGGVSVKFANGILVGNYEDTLKYLDRFAKHSPVGTKILRTKMGDIKVTAGRRAVEVYLPAFNHKFYFSNIAEASNFLRKDKLSFDELTRMAAEKGMRLDTWGSKYVAYGKDTGKAIVATDYDSLAKSLKAVPAPDYAPELSGMPDEFIETLDPPPPGAFEGGELFAGGGYVGKGPGAVGYIKQMVQPLDYWLPNMVEKGAPPIFLEKFREFQAVRQALHAVEHTSAKAITAIFTDPASGKLMKAARRESIYRWISSPEAERPEVARMFGLGEQELRVAANIRKFWGENIDSGMFARFGVDPEKFIVDYIPRLRKHYLTHPGEFMGHAIKDKNKLLHDTFGGQIPKELDAFFKHTRFDTIANDLLLEKDPMALMLRYAQVGNRQLIMGPWWTKTVNWMKTEGKTLDPILNNRLTLLFNETMGLPSGYTEALLDNVGRKILTKWGVRPTVIRDWITAAKSWGYLASMGFRAFTPVRNMFQIFTAGALRLENKWIVSGLHDIADDATGAIVRGMQGKGLLSTELPLFAGDLVDKKGLLGNLTHLGMKWYKNTDDLSRAIMWKGARNAWTDAVEKFTSKGSKMTTEGFLDYTNASALNPDIKESLRKLVVDGKWETAGDLFAKTIMDETMFVYQKGMGPAAFSTGVMGRLFGMMGTYPASYVANVGRAMRYSPWLQKAAAATRWVANSTLIYQTLHEMGVEGRNFLFFQEMMFAGGPYYTLANQALGMLAPGYKGRQNRAEFLGIGTKDGKVTINLTKGELWKWITPAGFFLKNLQHAADLTNSNSDPWEVFASVLSVPVVRDTENVPSNFRF